ncbi:MAG: pentapeptide repeat-containing protein [Rikenellaceae bacterium]|jgi:uncharacterized protein YjbI with pentapeptide repeats|nr:pentapeptide repeat-containing protein [Rikenellaceae bacterium]
MNCILDTTFTRSDPMPPAVAEYERCRFAGCDMREAELPGRIFIECRFEECDMSLASLRGTALREVLFVGCKMLGARFDECNAFGLEMAFEECRMDNASLCSLRLPHTTFRRCSLREADLAGCDLTGAVFDECDLTGAIFDNTIVEQADLRSARNFSIDPEANYIRRARFSLSGLAGLLEKYDIITEGF